MELTESYATRFSGRTLRRYAMLEVRDAAAILADMNPAEFEGIAAVLGRFRLEHADIVKPGGQEGPVAKRLNRAFRQRGWREGRHDLTIGSLLRRMPYREAGEKKPTVAESKVVSEGYKVDNLKGKVALDVEWNAKDGNLDRDLAAYRALYEAGIVQVGVILTRTQSDLRALGKRLGRDPFKTSTTTNLDKLRPRLARGDGGGCPVLAVAITAACLPGRR